ncbi:hypothetical protein HPP92_015687 [Vanilla planifolia]|uniref:F-box/LRR-repeat protein 15/At3g58940/PEG3-like LRR domain-containing protein n=1 Tax=Vanilla planifolia TaxID=51239 RepID=A0A835UVC4_VANPL|nr:hypothetical protein HPP92_015687 [Vanilla planifolia]
MVRWKELEILEMTWKPDSFVEVLEQIRMNCPNFMGLHICGFFDEEDAQAIVRCLPRLKILVMSGSFVRRRDLMVILDGCKELEVLDVSMCRGFDADSEIVQKASRIRRFECGDSKMESNHTSTMICSLHVF